MVSNTGIDQKAESAKSYNWIALTDEEIAVVTFDTLRQARHVLGVSMPVPKQIRLFDSLTLDSSSGGLVRGFSHADPRPEAAVGALREILNRAQNVDHGRALLIIDGVYEFAFSIGVYVRAAVMDPKQQANGGGSQ